MTTPVGTLSIVITADGAAAESLLATLESVAAARLPSTEIIYVVAASDPHAAIASRMPDDVHVRVVTTDADATRSHSRRRGLRATSGTYIAFLVAGDLLSDPTALARARASVTPSPDGPAADVVVFDRPARDEKTSASARRSPRAVRRSPDAILGTFASDVDGPHVRSRLLLRSSILRDIDRRLGDIDAFEDTVVMLLAAAAGASFVLAPSAAAAFERRGESAAGAAHPDAVRNATRAVSAAVAIEPVVSESARHSPNPEPLLLGYEGIRERAIGDALEGAAGLPEPQGAKALDDLRTIVSEADIVAAAARSARVLAFVASRTAPVPLGSTPVRSVLLTTNIVTTGGVSGVLLTQARFLIDAGHRVTVVAHRAGSDESALPSGAAFEQITGATKAERMRKWAEVCRRHEIDLVIDHRVLYSRDWHEYALVSTGAGIPTIGWIHNFAARPTYNGNDLHTLLAAYLPALSRLIVLSPLDVAFWKLRGIDRTSYLPNPPSPLLLSSAGSGRPRLAPAGRRLELVWWGRLEEHTKKVTALVDVASSLKRSGVDFRLRIVGPDWTDMSASSLRDLVSERSLDGMVEITGPMHGQELLDAVDSSDLFVNTSIIEGYPLTLSEAQARGLPVAMYDLPWLALLEANDGVLTVPQGDADALAAAIADLASDPNAYEAASRASIAAAQRAVSHDFATLYAQLVRGELPDSFSPAPTREDAERLLRLLLFFAENATFVPARAPSRRGGRRATARTNGRGTSWAARLESRLTPLGHDLVTVFPWARPAARRVKNALLHR